MSLEILAARVMNAAGVSVGTSLALETILPNWPVFDPEREKPPAVNLMDYQEVWFNLKTLYRNLYNSINREDLIRLVAIESGEELARECETILHAIKEASHGAVKAHFYDCDYTRLNKKFPYAGIREITAPKQIAFQETMRKALQMCKVQLEAHVEPGEFTEEKNFPEPKKRVNALILTHHPVDLLSEARFNKLALLESHTGLVKQKNLWYTKFFNGKTLSVIPFSAFTLQIFGDDRNIKPQPAAVRQELVNLATQNNWTWMTSPAKIRMNIQGLKDQFFSQILLKML